MNKCLPNGCDLFFNLQRNSFDKAKKFLSNYFVKELLWNSNEVLHDAIFFSWYETIIIIFNQLLQFYLLIFMRILQSINVITLKAPTSLVRLVIPFFYARFVWKPVLRLTLCIVWLVSAWNGRLLKSFVEQTIDFYKLPYIIYCCLFW